MALAILNLNPVSWTRVSLTDTTPFGPGLYIIRYGASGEFTSTPIICYRDKLIIAYTNTHYMAVFCNARGAISYIDPNCHATVKGNPPYGVIAIYKLEVPA